jgi:hypothetical protein
MKKVLLIGIVVGLGAFAFSSNGMATKNATGGKCSSEMMKSEKCKIKSEKNSTMKMNMNSGMKCQAGKCSGGK